MREEDQEEEEETLSKVSRIFHRMFHWFTSEDPLQQYLVISGRSIYYCGKYNRRREGGMGF